MYKIAIGTVFGVLLFSKSAMALCSSFPYTLTNGTTADAIQVMADLNCAALTQGATLDGATLTGTTSFANGSGPTITLSKSGGSSAEFLMSGTPTFLIEDDSISASSLAVAGWSGSAWTNIANFRKSGGLLVNTTAQPIGSGPRYLVVNGGTSAAAQIYNQGSAETVEIWSNVSSGVATHIQFFYGASASPLGTITSDGTQTYYNAVSDARMKNIAIPQNNYRSIIHDLWVGDFKWKTGGVAGFGVVAQQTYPLFPQAVSRPATKEGLWEVDYSKLAPLALWGTKDLYRVTDAQSKMINALQKDLRDADGKVASLSAANDNDSAKMVSMQTRIAELEKRFNIQTARK